MRKLIVSMNLSLDGFMSGPHCDLDWHFESWNDEMGEKLLELLGRTDTLLLGRITYEAMAVYWPIKPLQENFPRKDLAIAAQMNLHQKIVFSNTGIEPQWQNSKWIRGKVQAEILKLKKEKGKDIILFGSGRLVSEILQHGLADEYRLWVHPVILGKGKLFFRELNKPLKLRLTDSFLCASGVFIFSYEPLKT